MKKMHNVYVSLRTPSGKWLICSLCLVWTQEVQSDLEREQNSLHNMDSQKQDAQVRLDEMDQQRSKLEGMLNEVKQKCHEESQQVRNGTF